MWSRRVLQSIQEIHEANKERYQNPEVCASVLGIIELADARDCED